MSALVMMPFMNALFVFTPLISTIVPLLALHDASGKSPKAFAEVAPLKATSVKNKGRKYIVRDSLKKWACIADEIALD